MTWLAAKGRYDRKRGKILLTAVAVTDGKAEASAMATIDAARPGTDPDKAALALGCELAKANGHDSVTLWPEQSDAAKSVCSAVWPDGTDYFNTGVDIIPGTPTPKDAACLNNIMRAIEETMPGSSAGTADESLADRVLALYENTPDGHGIQDADTVLADMMDNAESELTGIGPEVIRIWQESHDKKSIEKLFLSFTGHEFEQYLKLCESKTTRK